MTQYVQEKIEKMEQPITAWVLLSIAFSLVSMYAYFVNGAIVNIVFARETETNITELSSIIGSLEGELLSAKTGINTEYIRSMGFVTPVSEPTYIVRRPSVSLSFNK